MDDTTSSRKKIGFPNKEEWKSNTAHYTDDSLYIAGHHVMGRWETDYMCRLAHIVCQNGGHILELGYGMGISSDFIQKNKKIITHTIIECHPEVAQECRKKYTHEISEGSIILCENFWEDIIYKLPNESYDGILFDTYPLTEEQIHKNHYWFFKDAYRLLKKGGVLTYYSDEKKGYSKEHMEKLKEAGFTHIGYHVCKVNPPQNMYWNDTSILAPE